MRDALTVGRMQPGQSAHVVALIVEGLTERWGAYDPTMNPDLQRFPACFGDSVILVASRGGLPLGVGILRPAGLAEAEIVRMSVRREFRRTGIGTKILSELLGIAKMAGIRTIRLETTASWKSAASFYEKHGFLRTHVQDADQHFAVQL